MEKTKNKTYRVEFKEAAVKQANESDLPVSETVRNLGVNVNTLFTWIQQQSREFPVNLICDTLQVSRSFYYAWVSRQPTTYEVEETRLKNSIEGEFTKSRAVYGTRGLKHALARQNFIASRRRIGRLMRELGLACKTKRKFKATTNSAHESPIAENVLNRKFSVEKPDQAYVGATRHCPKHESKGELLG